MAEAMAEQVEADAPMINVAEPKAPRQDKPVEVHEQPYLTSVSETVLETGMVFSIEPGIYLPGRFGIRLEDIVILREDGPEIFSDLPRDLTVI